MLLSLLCRFPTQGGTGGIWKAVSKLLPSHQQRFCTTVTSIDAEHKTVTLQDGKTIQYQALLSTLPLDTTCRWLGQEGWSNGLQHSSSHIVGFGIRGECPHGAKCWLYFPEDDCPFYRWAFPASYCSRRDRISLQSSTFAMRLHAPLQMDMQGLAIHSRRLQCNFGTG
jgi:protoporphyrinogen oxidase